ncbi:TolC family protein [Gemmatimonas sp.]|uniref:TolC family protein n=2 Tax=Gemmatimonas sp. TaxID=1962908 RepID=UPI0022BCA618|nr:TolC family protein [Gemmatimonas sp.]MCZ8267622.1 TolC family protein [Gemmatimonas sp.]
MRSPMFRLLLPALLAASHLPAQPQTSAAPDSLSITLTDALARLSAREPRLTTASALRDVARAARGEALSARRNRLLPVVSAGYGTQRLAQNQFVEIGRRAGIPPVPADQLDPFARVFASPNTRTASLNAAIRPFDGGVASANVDAARAGVQAATLAQSQLRAALETEVVARYADVQLQRRLRDVADSALAQAQRTLAVTRQAVAQGRTPEFEIWRVEADVQALRPARIDADRQLQLADLALRQLLDLPGGTPLRLESPAEPWSDSSATGSGATDSLGFSPLAASSSSATGTAPRTSRLALRELDARTEEAAARHRAAWRALLPVLDVTLSHQRLAYPLRGGNWGGPYYQNTLVGVSLSLPLDLTGATTARIESAAASERLAQAQRRAAERQNELEQTDLALQRHASRAAWQAAVAGAASADKALRVAQARHDVGRASLLELQDARLTWQQAMATRARAARDRTVIEARAARFDRLPLLPLQP